MNIDYFDRVLTAADGVRMHLHDQPFPRIAVVLGSGLGAFADSLEHPTRIPYADIPGLPTPTVPGHAGNLILARVDDVPVAVLQGRFHYYEGHQLADVTLPILVLAELGVQTLILTAAVGGLRATYGPGTIVALSDHLNLIGANPLRGSYDDRLGPRFPDMSEVYCRSLRAIADSLAAERGIALPSGVYACLPGPSYETPAEIRMLGILGADVVGMSTVPEAIVARQAGLKVLAFAVVSNWAAGISAGPITHAEVLEAGRAVGPRLTTLLTDVISVLGRGEQPS